MVVVVASSKTAMFSSFALIMDVTGRFQLTSSSKLTDVGDIISLSPNGHLYFHLTKNTYHAIGLVGKASLFYIRPHDKKYGRIFLILIMVL